MSNTTLYFNDCEKVLSINMYPTKPIGGEINTTEFSNLTSISIRNASLDKIIGLGMLDGIQAINIINDPNISPGLPNFSINEFGLQFKKNLVYFNITNNLVEGGFVYGLSLLSSIRHFIVKNNMLKFAIPSLSDCANLVYADFSNNNFDSLPSEYSSSLINFDASFNKIFKPILTFDFAHNLKSFNVSNNIISIFDAVVTPTSLLYFDASNNYFTPEATLNCLVAFDVAGNTNGTIILSGANMPSGATDSISDAQIQQVMTNLIDKGWRVTLGEKDSASY